MKLLCVIDHLGSGGAQRQMSLLTAALARRGHEVELFVYFPQFDFFAAGLREAGVRIHECRKGRGFSPRVLFALRALIARGGHDAVLSFLDTPNIYAELARLLSGRRVPLLVSERSSYLADPGGLRGRLSRALYRLATGVVTNNMTQRDWLRRKYWLRDKVTCIYNGLDLSAYVCRGEPPPGPSPKFIGIGRITPLKNIDGIVLALEQIDAAGGDVPEVSWAGRVEESAAGVAYRARIDLMLAQRPRIAARWTWLGERRDIASLLCSHDALIHPAHYEGLPNAVCEAFSSGRPALMSAVCDHPALAGAGERGLLFDPRSPAAMADAIMRFAKLTREQRLAMSRAARLFAEQHLGIDAVAQAYETLFARVARPPRPAA
jgi:glycosyltransferase involved in cell wall biosynthesis